AERLPAVRPARLRLHRLDTRWYRIDRQPPDGWTWDAFPTARYRFDSASGAFRIRYAGDDPRVAMRERFDDVERIVLARDLGLRIVELTGTIEVLDLRRDRTLDALGLDDQINTGRAPGVWTACHLLAALVQEWFGERCHGI